MEEGTLLRWLKQVGDQIDVGDPIAEIETDKVVLEIESTASGVLTKTLVAEGQAVPIGTSIALVGAEGEVVAEEPAPAAPEPVAVAAPAPVAAAAAAPVQEAPPPANTISEATAAPVRDPGDRMRASPIVKRLAEEHGLDLNAIVGTGPGGRIVKDDVMPFVTGAKPAPVAAKAAPAPAQTAGTGGSAPSAAPTADGVAREMSRIRKTTGRRMTEAKEQIPHFYVSTVVNMSAAAKFRERVNEQATDDASKVSFNDLIVKASALALRAFPNLNTSYENAVWYDHANIDINVAVAIENGLIAPFVRDADSKSLGAIARETKDLIGRARNGGLEPAEFQGGTFTISNLGMFDVDEFIAIINPPQCAILAVGSIADVPVVKASGKVKSGKQMTITLSADHRLTDGAEVARFMMAVKSYLEHPMQLAIS
ncbi:MAG TPA: dihydrolipoamide acetyltransferase family protein [Thermomicrobiales bacterium]|nr:dihydrolipoamide acetyltransferase family protein [Thermomicrobiales bacterium]